jgi:hypothetical protein
MSKRLALAALVFLALSAGRVAAYDPEPRPLLGKWERKSGKETITLVVEANRLHIFFAGKGNYAIHADYAMTRDGTVFGVVTSADTAEENDKEENELIDMPFSFRFRIDEGTLILRDFRMDKEKGSQEWLGRFKRVGPEPSQPVPTPVAPVQPALPTPARTPQYHFEF